MHDLSPCEGPIFTISFKVHWACCRLIKDNWLMNVTFRQCSDKSKQFFQQTSTFEWLDPSFSSVSVRILATIRLHWKFGMKTDGKDCRKIAYHEYHFKSMSGQVNLNFQNPSKFETSDLNLSIVVFSVRILIKFRLHWYVNRWKI